MTGSVEVSRQAAFVLPSSVRDVILRDSAGPWGTLHVKWNLAQQLGLITGGTCRGVDGFQSKSSFVTEHQSRHADLRPDFGVWYRTSPDVVDLWTASFHRRAAVAPETLAAQVSQGWKVPPADGSVQLVVTTTTLDQHPVCLAWNVDQRQAIPLRLDIVEEQVDPLSDLDGLWPLDELASTSAVLVGLGSVGGSAALALAGYGVRKLTLIDPDRLERRNLVRHVLDQSYIGHFKVAGVSDLIASKWPMAEVTPLALDVITDADAVRPILREASIVVASPDGVAPRQAVNHLARWSKTPAIYAAVFDDGGIGEIIRSRPTADQPCLSCVRMRLRREQVLEPERTLDLGYGTGQVHRPMTAVGPDVSLVGQLAAKFAVATLLEDLGHSDQALPGDHLVFGLRPVPGLESPFDVTHPLSQVWHGLGRPEVGCPDCDPL